MKKIYKAFLRDTSGTVAIEYGLILVIIVIGTIAAMASLGGSVTGFFDSVVTGFNR